MSKKQIYAFDIDGTLTIPAIKDLANTLYAYGHTVYIITGGLCKLHEDEDIDRRVKHRKVQLEKLGVPLYTELFVCVGDTTENVAFKKASICREHNVDLMFEDSRIYIETIRAYSKTVVVDVKN